MAYIGTQPLAGQYRKLDDISSGFNGATTSFTTSVGGTNVTAGSPQQLLVSLGGVIQQPTTDYTVNTSTIIFTTAPASGLSFFAILMGDALNTSVPADGSITSAKLAGSLSVGLAAGSASTPSLFFTGDTNTGIYSSGADQVSFATGGTERLRIDSTGQIEAVSLGTAAAPTYSFTTDPNTGIWSPAADTIAFSEGGVEAMRIDSSGRVGIGSTGPRASLEISDGSTNTAGEAVNELYVVGATTADSEGIVTIQSNDSIAANKGGSIAFGGRAVSASTAGANWAIINGFKENASSANYAGYLSFVTRASGGAFSERARLDSSGRLLVGTSTSPSAGNGSYSNLVVGGQPSASTSYGNIAIVRNQAASALVTNSGIGGISFCDNTGGTFADILCQADATPGSNDFPGRLVFSTCPDGSATPVERMRIMNGGGCSIYSSTTSNDTIDSCNNQGAGTTYSTFIGRHSATTTQSGTVSVRIYTNGNIQNTNGSYTTLSDAKLKENIVDAGSQWDDLKSIRIRKWNFKEETGHETHRQIGPIAQELEQVCPGLVFQTPDRDADGHETGEVTKGVNQSVLYMKAVKALQEAMERIEQLEAEMAEVKAQLS